MVGWSRRNAEDAARRKRYTAWFNAQPVEAQEEIIRKEEERWKRDKPKFIALMILGFVTVFILLPLGVMLFKPRIALQHRIIDGKDCIIYPRGCTSTGACWPERIECR